MGEEERARGTNHESKYTRLGPFLGQGEFLVGGSSFQVPVSNGPVATSTSNSPFFPPLDSLAPCCIVKKPIASLPLRRSKEALGEVIQGG